MIEFRNVTKYYNANGKRQYILDNVSLVLPSGKNIGILGPNGAGKSTTLRLIGGAEAPNSGAVISDQMISWPLGLATGFQGSLTARQNVRFICEINGLSNVEIQKVMTYALEFTELGRYFDMPVSTFSSGMRGRLTFALSMAFRFDVYLVDEITSVGDQIFREKAKKAFIELKERASLMFVSHNLKTVRETCDSALFLRRGNATFYDDINEGIFEYKKFIQISKGIKNDEHDMTWEQVREIRVRKSARKIALRRKRRKAQQAAKKNPSRGKLNTKPEDPNI